MKIPKQVRIGRKKYEVRKMRTVARDAIGGINYGMQLIMVGERNPVSKRDLTPREQSETFWHEITHAILKDMRNDLEADEKFVTAFSRRLTNAIHSAKF